MSQGNIHSVLEVINAIEKTNAPFTVQDIVELLQRKGKQLSFKEVENSIRTLHASEKITYRKTEVYYNSSIGGFRGAPPKVLADNPKYENCFFQVLESNKGTVEFVTPTKTGMVCVRSATLLSAKFHTNQMVTLTTLPGKIIVSPANPKQQDSITLKPHYDTLKPRLIITKTMLSAAKIANKGSYLIIVKNNHIEITTRN